MQKIRVALTHRDARNR